MQAKVVEYSIFKDPIGRFEIPYPKDWKFNPDILVVEGEYSESFQSRNKATFTINVNFGVDKNFNFEAYVKNEFYGPHSGMHSAVEKEKYQGKKAYQKEYSYENDGKKYFGGEKIFFKEGAIYLLTYQAFDKDKEEMTKIFEYMINNLFIKVKN